MASLVPPGPRGLRTVPALARNPFSFCTKAVMASGDGVACVGVGRATAYLVSDPDVVHHVLVGNAHNFIKGPLMNGIRVALGNGLFTADDPLWRRQRILVQPAFHAEHITQIDTCLQDAVAAGVGRWLKAAVTSRPVDLLAELIEINTVVVLRALLGVDAQEFATGMGSSIDAVFHGMSRRMWTFFLPDHVRRLVPGNTAYEQSVAHVRDRIDRITARRRENSERYPDILGLLLGAQDEDGASMSNAQLRDEVFTTLLAGTESTASTLSWLVWRLTDHPEVIDQIRFELFEAGVGVGMGVPRLEMLPQLPYLDQVVREGFRLEPAFPMFFRTAVAADTLGDYAIQGGANVVLCPYATHRDSRFWPAPEVFDPDRFAPGKFSAKQRRAYYPLGVGKRKCVAEPMAMAIARVLVAALVNHFDFALPRDYVVRPRYAMSLQPRGGMPVMLSRRSARHGGESVINR